LTTSGSSSCCRKPGFHPLEVIRSATLSGAQLIYNSKGRTPEFGSIRPGLLADLVIVPENPIANFKVLYGTGAMRLNDQWDELSGLVGSSTSIKDGIVYDAKKLLADVERIVEESKKRAPVAAN
jgi:predicted amidohydrolase YtcJ